MKTHPANKRRSKKNDTPSKAKAAAKMDAVELLKSQHREVEALFKQLDAQTESADKQALFKQIADALAMHAAIEEMHFYPAVRDRRTEDILLESLQEHLAIKRVIADLMRTRASEQTFDAKIKVLKEQVEHHVEEEEEDLFPKVKRIFDRDDLRSLAIAMQQEQAQLVGTNPSARVPAETSDATPLV